MTMGSIEKNTVNLIEICVPNQCKVFLFAYIFKNLKELIYRTFTA